MTTLSVSCQEIKTGRRGYSGEYSFLWDEMKIPNKHGSDLKKTLQSFIKYSILFVKNMRFNRINLSRNIMLN